MKLQLQMLFLRQVGSPALCSHGFNGCQQEMCWSCLHTAAVSGVRFCWTTWPSLGEKAILFLPATGLDVTEPGERLSNWEVTLTSPSSSADLWGALLFLACFCHIFLLLLFLNKDKKQDAFKVFTCTDLPCVNGSV